MIDVGRVVVDYVQHVVEFFEGCLSWFEVPVSVLMDGIKPLL